MITKKSYRNKKKLKLIITSPGMNISLSKQNTHQNMNNKVEIFKLALKAGNVELTEEQLTYVVDCFITTEKLSNTEKGPRRPKTERAPKGPKTLNGRGLFIKEKMAAIKDNGNDYLINKAIAVTSWKNLSKEDKEEWKNKATSVV